VGQAVKAYGLGAPFWSFPGWNGSLYSADARPQDRLRQYARVFNAVEGNTTFWGVPSARTVGRWRDAVPESFRFHLKLPREITHERQLEGTGRLGVLEGFLRSLPRDRCWSVEVRHPAFFSDARAAAEVDALLAAHGCDRVMTDTRALRAGDAGHPEVIAALHKKPDLPLRPEPIGSRPMVRFIGHPNAATNEPWVEEWADRVAGWIAGGLQPSFFVHTASNLRTPELARTLHQRISARVAVGQLPPFPGECGEHADGQLPLL
jgi:uncharacterized protein YecE (DUF72 family)